MNKLAVVAFGGNALLKSDQKGTISEQEANVYETCTHLLDLIKAGYDIVIGHGNGPQVGNVLLQHEAGEKTFGIPKLPIDVCVAETQGSIGYMIEQELGNLLPFDVPFALLSHRRLVLRGKRKRTRFSTICMCNHTERRILSHGNCHP